MLQSTLRAVGLSTDYDIPAGELFSKSLNADKYGLGPEQMETIHCLKDFVSEYNRELPIATICPIKTSSEAAALVYPMMRDMESEEVRCLFMNSANTPIKMEMICSGGLSSTVIEPRAIVKIALDCNASGVLLFHNHPSGNPTPSAADVKETERLRKCLSVFGMSLVDHIIICDACYFSFADEAISKYTLLKK